MILRKYPVLCYVVMLHASLFTCQELFDLSNDEDDDTTKLHLAGRLALSMHNNFDQAPMISSKAVKHVITDTYAKSNKYKKTTKEKSSPMDGKCIQTG